MEAMEAAGGGKVSGPIITRYRRSNSNLRTQLHRIIRKAGLKPWPKAFHNLRATRQTELEDQGYPTHVVCAWLGNTPKVARKHYLFITDGHLKRAVGGAAQNAAHSANVSACQGVPAETATAEKPSANAENAGFAGVLDSPSAPNSKA